MGLTGLLASVWHDFDVSNSGVTPVALTHPTLTNMQAVAAIPDANGSITLVFPVAGGVTESLQVRQSEIISAQEISRCAGATGVTYLRVGFIKR